MISVKHNQRTFLLHFTKPREKEGCEQERGEKGERVREKKRGRERKIAKKLKKEKNYHQSFGSSEEMPGNIKEKGRKETKILVLICTDKQKERYLQRHLFVVFCVH